ncbi:MAG: Na+/H+ antiporter NhaA [Acidimicrobiia bacterium]|nr:Na+/H+ antiporter NhaA [Acidimicrobiia bacterium]
MSEGSLTVRKETWSGSNSPLARAVARPMVKFLAQETASGVLLLVATAAALLWVNSPWGDTYSQFWETHLSINVGSTHLIDLSLHGWVNDALMALFFFVVGMEIKSELVNGDLSDPRVAALPAVGAVGGMVVPAALYLVFNLGGDASGGWGVPMATDIAFAVGVLALLGPRIPQQLKLFLLTLAIVDDIGAILVIAIFYTTSIQFGWLALAGGLTVLIVALRPLRVWYQPVYVLLGVIVWFATHESGVHATIAGVMLGLLAPAKPLLGQRVFESVEDVLSGDIADPVVLRDASFRLRETVPVTARLTNLLSPWTSFVIVPLFALANAGVRLSGDAVSGALTSTVTLGIVVGLVIGKPVGIYLFSVLALQARVAMLPDGLRRTHLLGAGAVAGIGFTVALFIASLAFDDPVLAEEAVIGILVASVAATVLGWLILRSVNYEAPVEQEEESVLVEA